MTRIHEFAQTPCPICNHVGWCGRREDGLILCKRPPSPPDVAGHTFKGLAQDGQTGMYVEAGREHNKGTAHRRDRDDRDGETCPPAPPAPLAEAHAAAVAAFTPERRAALATELGLPEAVLGELDIGWSDKGRHHGDHDVAGAWIFPEHDGQGRLIGVSYRFPGVSVSGMTDRDGKPLGTKSTPPGLKRGLTLPNGWREMPDPVLIVEGASDVLAARAAGLTAFGRPSNTGGIDFLAQLCRRRRVIVLGENDRKPDGRWPGKEGAELVARKLEAAWDRPVPIAMPPEGIKDLRDWVRQLAPDWAAAGVTALRETILAAARPPALLFLVRRAPGRDRVLLKVFRWADGIEAPAIHSDLLHLDDAVARNRFVKAVMSVVPDTDDLMRRLLTIKVPPSNPARTPHEAPEVPTIASRNSRTEASADSAPESPPAAGQSLPEAFLPGGPVPITESSAVLGGLLARTDRYYLRGGVVVTLDKDDDGLPILEVVKPAALASVFETVASLMKFCKEKAGFVPLQSVATEQDAKLIQHCRIFQQLLPPIRLLSRCPVLIERDGRLVQVSGYDRPSGIMAFGDPAPDIPPEEAVALLADLVGDFLFATAADRARALAAVVTPALVFGRLLAGRAPVDLKEADKSQAGKGFQNKVTAALYNHSVKAVTQKKGGVGSLEESFASALIKGYIFISLDNVRGEINSPAIESFLTEDVFLARATHLAAVEIDPRQVVIQMTSNKADVTVDLANRSSCVRILKQPEGYRFKAYPEGGILEHVRANQPLYLGAVFAVIRAWHAAGKPRTDEARHDFRPWAQTLDWIVQHVFRAGPLLDGHRQAQVRMSTPALNWLRDVALAVRNHDKLDRWLRANDLVEVIVDASGVELPGLPEGGDPADDEVRKKILQAIGRRMAACFTDKPSVSVDTLTVTRRKTEDSLGREVREYSFAIEKAVSEGFRYGSEAHSGRIAENAAQDAGSGPATGPAVAGRGGSVTDVATSPLCAPYQPVEEAIVLNLAITPPPEEA